jgi:hypothetical protein
MLLLKLKVGSVTQTNITEKFLAASALHLHIGSAQEVRMKTKRKKELLSLIRHGVRLDTKPPKVEEPKSVYKRKDKHRRRISNESSFLFPPLQHFILQHPSF